MPFSTARHLSSRSAVVPCASLLLCFLVQLTGGLPPEFGAPGAMPKLGELIVFENQLKGPVPTSYSRWGRSSHA